MPDIVTHATFAIDFINEINDIKLTKMLINNKPILMLGSQGPDVFYFYNLFRKNKNGFSKLGNMMHDNNISEFIITSIDYLKNNYNESLHVYVLGLLCHHALDRNAHPYVYNLTGKYNKNDENSFKFRGNHLRFERAIDSIFIKRKWNISPQRFRIDRLVLNYRPDKKIFIPFYDYVLKKVFNIDNGGHIFLNSVNNFRVYARLMYDPFGVKKTLAKFADNFNKKGKVVFETIFYYKNINENIDYLNKNNNKWHHPVTNETSYKGFDDLYFEALEQMINDLKLVQNYLNNKIKTDELNTSDFNLSYSSGLDWHTQKEMNYFNVIF